MPRRFVSVTVITMTKTETNSTFQGTSSLNGTLTEINGNIYVLNTGTKGAGFYKLAENEEIRGRFSDHFRIRLIENREPRSLLMSR